MNRLHGMLCSSGLWARMIAKRLPAMLDGAELGADVLEIGPGFGATTKVLVDRVDRLTALEVDQGYARRLEAKFADRARIVHGDGANMPFADGAFTGVVCFTMLHHVPSPELQDKLFAEVFRVLAPGGTFTGADSQTSVIFRLLHVGDTMVLIDPDTLERRLTTSSFTDVKVHTVPKEHVWFSARKPQ